MADFKAIDLTPIDSYMNHIGLDLDNLCQKVLDASLLKANVDGFAFVKGILLMVGNSFPLEDTRRKMKLYCYLMNNLSSEQLQKLRDPDHLYDDDEETD